MRTSQSLIRSVRLGSRTLSTLCVTLLSFTPQQRQVRVALVSVVVVTALVKLV
jgi:hypothetical protein